MSPFYPSVQPVIYNAKLKSGNARQMTISVGAILEGILLLWAYAPGMFKPEEQLQSNIALLFKGLESAP